jgi:hypothetical protein
MNDTHLTPRLLNDDCFSFGSSDLKSNMDPAFIMNYYVVTLDLAEWKFEVEGMLLLFLGLHDKEV